MCSAATKLRCRLRASQLGIERRFKLTRLVIELSENVLAVCLTLGLRSQELYQPKLCLAHIKSLALTIGNEAFHCRNMLRSLNYMLFDISQQKESFLSQGHGRAPRT